MQKRVLLQMMASLGLTAGASRVFALGEASGPAVVGYPSATGPLGEVIVNPYGIAPLTAVIKNGGFELLSATVKIEPKAKGSVIAYKVGKRELLTHAGVPVFGLYPDHVNKVDVTAKLRDHGEVKTVKHVYSIWCGPVRGIETGAPAERNFLFETEVKRMAPDFKDRLYLINNFGPATGLNNRMVWNNPEGGALTWNNVPQIAVIDATGDIRWYLDPRTLWKPESMDSAGVMMGFRQNPDGTMTWGFGQRYVRFDLMGREIFNRRLPAGYNDFSHAMDPMPNGHYLLRVASSDLRRADGKRIRTVRDVIIEVDQAGFVVDEWRLFDILDPYRSTVLKALDQGAVCLNIDPTKAGQTMSTAELQRQETDARFGDITGTGPGRNWAHVNSVDYDPTDDSIIISSRHQSAVIKIGRDKKVKWILSAPKGWREPWRPLVLKPVTSDGKPVACTAVDCKGGFDWTWTQHTAWRIDSKSTKDVVYITVFDNGDGRAFMQPDDPREKYSRAVVYKIDQKKMTVEQVWQYGKERGSDWYSPVTSLTEYQADKDSIVVYAAFAGAPRDEKTGKSKGRPNPYLEEFRWGETTPAVEIRLKNTMGYQAFPVSLKKIFTGK